MDNKIGVRFPFEQTLHSKLFRQEQRDEINLKKLYSFKSTLFQKRISMDKKK